MFKKLLNWMEVEMAGHNNLFLIGFAAFIY